MTSSVFKHYELRGFTRKKGGKTNYFLFKYAKHIGQRSLPKIDSVLEDLDGARMLASRSQLLFQNICTV